MLFPWHWTSIMSDVKLIHCLSNYCSLYIRCHLYVMIFNIFFVFGFHQFSYDMPRFFFISGLSLGFLSFLNLCIFYQIWEMYIFSTIFFSSLLCLLFSRNSNHPTLASLKLCHRSSRFICPFFLSPLWIADISYWLPCKSTECLFPQGPVRFSLLFVNMLDCILDFESYGDSGFFYFVLKSVSVLYWQFTQIQSVASCACSLQWLVSGLPLNLSTELLPVYCACPWSRGQPESCFVCTLN